jgi:hypothetical protein
MHACSTVGGRAESARPDGTRLRVGARVVATVVPDDDWPTMWCVRMTDGSLSDMVNRSRAKDAALSLALAVLNRRKAA